MLQISSIFSGCPWSFFFLKILLQIFLKIPDFCLEVHKYILRKNLRCFAKEDNVKNTQKNQRFKRTSSCSWRQEEIVQDIRKNSRFCQEVLEQFFLQIQDFWPGRQFYKYSYKSTILVWRSLSVFCQIVLGLFLFFLQRHFSKYSQRKNKNSWQIDLLKIFLIYPWFVDHLPASPWQIFAFKFHDFKLGAPLKNNCLNTKLLANHLKKTF